MIYTLIHGRDPIPCRTTYIEYRSPVNILIIFLRITTQFHWFWLQKSFFFHSSTTPVVGGTLRWAWKNIFFNTVQYKKKCHFGWPVFLLKRSSLGTSDIQGCYFPKGITYMIYTLIHERDPIPCRTTYIEYMSPVNIFINFLKITTQFHWFSLQKIFFHSSTTPVVGVPFGEPEKLIVLMQYKKKLIISGCPFFFWNVLVEELQTSRVATPQRELRI